MSANLNICEIFYSLQGESTFSGMPCIFIRLSGCNLDCSYCDTKYAFAEGREISITEILIEIAKYPCKLVEITGGEPMLQDECISLMETLHTQEYRIMLETNGSIYLGDVPSYVKKILDVKTPGSGFGASFMKWNLKLLNPSDELKFVITCYDDYRFARDFLDRNSCKDNIILFSPVLSVLPAETLVEWMLRDGVSARLQLQLHRLLKLR
ncbi:MAG: radical SAM protein [Candidatus Cloacimonadaceae bacterium]|nr:radical SAM protein [Candidatus Cloacimonadaceae bacterium]MDP3114624.1 radical SAM protein [Candidatus Cloacimonadaceae bacterium]